LLVLADEPGEEVQDTHLKAILGDERVYDALLLHRVLGDGARPLEPGAEKLAAHVAARHAYLWVSTDSLDLVGVAVRGHDELAVERGCPDGGLHAAAVALEAHEANVRGVVERGGHDERIAVSRGRREPDAVGSRAVNERAELRRTRDQSGPARDIVVIQDLHKSFDDVKVLDGIDMVCRRGETTCVVGGSGAGKTTLLRLIVALEKPDSGRIFIDGDDIVPMGEHELNEVRKKCGMVYQYAALLDSITVLDNVAFPLVEHTKLRASEIRERVIAKLQALGLNASVLDKYPPQLSGGMRKRVGVARALMLDPPILVYDEPTSGLDPLTSRTVDDMIDETRDRFGVTSVVITHDIASCFRIADQVLLLDRGRIVASGTPADLARGASDEARNFIAQSGVDVERAIAARRRK
jgi:phospholipid/cholesterol/gamma-HCH transport system ATP-binding protein